MTETPTDSWPTLDTVAGGPPHYAPPPPPPPEPDRRFGAGMLLAIAAVALAAGGVAIAYFLTHRDQRSDVTTVVTTSGTAPAGTPTTSRVTTSTRPSTSTRATTTTGATTATTTPTTTAAAPAAPRASSVPNVADTTEAAAVQSLNQAGLLASLAFVPGADPLGTVVAQAKPAGTSVPYHSHVQINISSGPGDKPKERVPNVIGRPLQQALAAINGANLRLLYLRFQVDSKSEAGKIVQQSPLGGAQAPRNAQVVVYLGAFSG